MSVAKSGCRLLEVAPTGLVVRGHPSARYVVGQLLVLQNQSSWRGVKSAHRVECLFEHDYLHLGPLVRLVLLHTTHEVHEEACQPRSLVFLLVVFLFIARQAHQLPCPCHQELLVRRAQNMFLFFGLNFEVVIIAWGICDLDVSRRLHNDLAVDIW